MGKWCLYASLFIFDWIIIKVASNQDRHKSSVEVNFGPSLNTHFALDWRKFQTFELEYLWSKLANLDQILCMCSIIGVGERLHKVLRQIDLGTLDSGERSLPFGLLVFLHTQREFLRGWLWKWNEARHDKTNKVTRRPAKTQISLGIRPVWSESSLCAWWVA